VKIGQPQKEAETGSNGRKGCANQSAKKAKTSGSQAAKQEVNRDDGRS
jgi:hypothetical protein